jgi:hypothetical protein
LRIRLAMSPVLSSTWAKLVPKWVRFRAMLEPSWAEIGTRRVQVGNLGPCWPKLLMLRPCRIETVHLANVGPMLGRSQNVQILPQSLRRIHCYTTTPGHLQCRWTCWLFMHDGIRHAISVHAYIDRYIYIYILSICIHTHIKTTVQTFTCGITWSTTWSSFRRPGSSGCVSASAGGSHHWGSHQSTTDSEHGGNETNTLVFKPGNGQFPI